MHASASAYSEMFIAIQKCLNAGSSLQLPWRANGTGTLTLPFGQHNEFTLSLWNIQLIKPFIPTIRSRTMKIATWVIGGKVLVHVFKRGAIHYGDRMKATRTPNHYWHTMLPGSEDEPCSAIRKTYLHQIGTAVLHPGMFLNHEDGEVLDFEFADGTVAVHTNEEPNLRKPEHYWPVDRPLRLWDDRKPTQEEVATTLLSARKMLTGSPQTVCHRIVPALVVPPTLKA